MMEAEPTQEMEMVLDSGDAQAYTDQRIFGGKIDSLRAHIDRKKALADEFRYSILYLLYEYGQISRSRLAREMGRDGNQLHHHLEKLVKTNLLKKITAPEDADGRQTYYRITTLGKQEIAGDIEHIVGGEMHKRVFEVLGDPELVDGMDSANSRVRPQITIDSDQLHGYQGQLRTRGTAQGLEQPAVDEESEQ